ncbi:MAG: hypothetical protein LBT40_16010 [Deltaproteobacteria bacterium]|jgi:hypothetical protein|nr:hypothetical protein [Deltaproteobacteria bacterium]
MKRVTASMKRVVSSRKGVMAGRNSVEQGVASRVRGTGGQIDRAGLGGKAREDDERCFPPGGKKLVLKICVIS